MLQMLCLMDCLNWEQRQQKLDSKARYLLYQCVGPKVFHRISEAETAREIWEILVKTYGDGDRSKKMKMQILRRQFECLAMEDNDIMADYFDRVQEHVNAMRACRDTITDQYVADKILRSLPPRYDHIMVAIEETRDMETMGLEELQHTLESHEHRLNKRRQFQDQVLQARSQYRGKGKGSKKYNKKNDKRKETQEHHKKDSSDQERRKDHKTDQGSNGEHNWKFDKQKVRCFNCQKLGHFAKECWKGDGAKNKPKNQAQLAQDETSDSEPVMLMAKTDEDEAECSS